MSHVTLVAGLAIAGAVVLGGVGALTSSGSTGRGPAGISSVAGLAGVWRAEHDGRVYHEMWMAPEHGQMTGAMRCFDADGAVRLLELLTLTESDDGLTYRVRHFDGAMTPWSSEADGPLIVRAGSASGGRITFEPLAEGGSLASITFDLSKTDRSRVTIAFAGDSGREPLVLDFERVGAAP